MRKRLQIGPDGLLVDRDGRSWGKLVSITVDLDPDGDGPEAGGKGVIKTTEEKTKVGTQTELLDGGPGETSGVDLVAEVWAHYVTAMTPRRTELGPEERKIIREALKVATADELRSAITGCAKSDWHMGRDSQTGGKKYNDLSQIIKAKRAGPHSRGFTTRERIDFFLDMERTNDSFGIPDSVPSGLRGRVVDAIRQVLEAERHPDREAVRERGEQALAMLKARFKLHPVTDGNGRLLSIEQEAG